MPPFIESVLQWATLTGGHFIFMFWWILGLAVVLTALSESFWVRGRLRRLLERPDDGWGTVWRAVVLGVLSPPSRSRMFLQARELLASGVSPAGVMAYLVSAQALFIWLLVLIVELNGPQPVIGQVVAVGAALAVLLYGLRRTPERLWRAARESAAKELPHTVTPPIARRGPVWARLPMSLVGQVYSLWWPMVFGLLGVGFFLALGQSTAYISLQGSKVELTRFGGHLSSEGDRRSPRCQEHMRRTRRSFGGRWSSWSGRAAPWRSWPGSSSPQTGRYGTGSNKLTWMKAVAVTG